jgi:hypothetical protein
MAVEATPKTDGSADVVVERTSRISPVAWIPVTDMDFAQWATAGRRLAAMGRCGQWGIGDWIRYGNSKFGERYAWASRVTGYDIQTLMNMVYVASRIDISRRRENLSWSHHETVASLDRDEQEHWLDRVDADRLSVADLRGELRRVRRAARGEGAQESGEDPTVSERTVICPHCGGRVPLPKLPRRRSAEDTGMAT